MCTERQKVRETKVMYLLIVVKKKCICIKQMIQISAVFYVCQFVLEGSACGTGHEFGSTTPWQER